MALLLIVTGCGGGGGEGVPTQINWTPPTLKTDGSLLTDLSKYRLYYGPDENSLTAVLDIDSEGVTFTSHTFSAAEKNTLASFLSGNATHVFALTAINSQSIESSFSIIVTY